MIFNCQNEYLNQQSTVQLGMTSNIEPLAQAAGIIKEIFQDLQDQGHLLQRYPGTYKWKDPYSDIDNWNADLQTRYRTAVGQIGNEVMAMAMHSEPFENAFRTAQRNQWYNLMLLVNAEKTSLRMFAIARNVPYARNYRAHGRNRFLRSLGRLNEHPLTNREEQSVNWHPHLIYLTDRGQPARCSFTPNDGTGQKEMVNMYENRYVEDRFRRQARLRNWPSGWNYPRHPQYAAMREGQDANWPACEHCGKSAVFGEYVKGRTVYTSWDEQSVCTCSKYGGKPWALEPLVEVYQYPSYTGSSFDINRGVRALQNIPEGEIIGEYCGTFVPLQEEDTCGDGSFLMGWEGPSRDFFHPDAEKICILSGGLAGNWTRFMNHTDKEEEVSARMYQFPYGGKMRIIVQAARDIVFGEQILTSYGPGYFGGDGMG
ncbi:hypothetical protein HYFRA_00008294 [Hymenoscyphus fraxineus]|uniref:SET domain-containing protein n=1 Tax=Hymenoscyphus fraxineus TaxID=746836 RepID=A0A9N9PQ37_9HELO|nr:hypothetical protein HYFRA_00008294 [Hymenoscyphus fraxineus]